LVLFPALIPMIINKNFNLLLRGFLGLPLNLVALFLLSFQEDRLTLEGQGNPVQIKIDVIFQKLLR